MYNKTILLTAALLVATATLAWMTPEQKEKITAIEERACLISRDTQTLPGYIIEHWNPPIIDKMGEAHYVFTNKIFTIKGYKQKNTWRETIATLTNNVAKAEAAQRLAEAYALVQSNRAERASARIDNTLTYLEEKRDEAKLPTTKALYQAIIDKINELATQEKENAQ